MRRVYELLARVAPSGATVLVVGESGTGKELAAMELHSASTRRERPLVSLDCSALASVEKEAPDLVVLDVMMENDWAGYGVVQAMHAASPEPARRVPIVMVSSVGLDPSSRFAGAGEAPMVTPDRYLVKPLDVNRFLRCVGELLGLPLGEERLPSR